MKCPAPEPLNADSSQAWPSTIQSAASSGSPTRRSSIREQHSSVPLDKEDLFEAEQKTLGRLLARRQKTEEHGSADSPEAIQHLSNFMTLLGPRYKVLPRHVLWERANRDESEYKKPPRHHNITGGQSNTMLPLQAARRHSLTSLDGIDPDGGARAAWLAARAREKERHARESKSPLAGGSSPAGQRLGTDRLGFMIMTP